jgi:hypothetical protein
MNVVFSDSNLKNAWIGLNNHPPHTYDDIDERGARGV